jgi:hypothetical protein
MKRTMATLALVAALQGLVSAQSTGYRADIGIETINIEAPGVNPQASQVIVPAKTACQVVVKVQNKSDRILDGYQLQIVIGGQVVGTETQGTMRPQEIKTHRIRYSAVQPGNFAVTARILPKFGSLGASEDNPRNNEASIPLTVEGGAGSTRPGGLADLVLDGVSPSELAAMDKVILEIRIGNRGGTDVSSAVDLDVEAAGQHFRARTTAGIPAGKTGFATVEVMKERWQRNPHGTVMIDPSHSVKESDVSNNRGRF